VVSEDLVAYIFSHPIEVSERTDELLVSIQEQDFLTSPIRSHTMEFENYVRK
jgi:hypothetical protein